MGRVINWTDVAAAGNTFTAVKASEGTYYVNPYYASDAVQAAKAGLLVIPYAARQKTGQCYGLSRTALVTWIQRFMAEAQIKTGRKPVIYTTTAWWKACTGNSAAFGSYPLWIASYGKSDPALPAGWTTSPSPARQSGSQAGRSSGSRSARERAPRGRWRR